MQPLSGKKIALGITGSVAAYKAVEVCRRLVERGAHVIPVMTESAEKFVGEITFSSLASEKARTSLWQSDDPVPHISLAHEVDLFLICPATANLIASYANGFAHDLLTSALVETDAPVIICPAMHTGMLENDAVQQNIEVLRNRGVEFIDAETGELAHGDYGKGRLAEPHEIVQRVVEFFNHNSLAGNKVVVTAGGTREPIDAVRFISNRSSGKQGFAIAEEAARRGAEVTLITTQDRASSIHINKILVNTAEEMERAVDQVAKEANVVVMAAAVADFRPKSINPNKIDKSTGIPPIEFEPTVDILAKLGKTKSKSQVLVGFAAETSENVERARQKMQQKNADLIILNDISADGVGFDHDTNAVTIITEETEQDVPKTTKRAVAGIVLDAVEKLLASK